MTLRGLANTLLSSLFEPTCAACSQGLLQPLNGAVCERCWASIGRGTSLNEIGRAHV